MSEDQANARLIAAAPDMLAALFAYVDLYDTNPATWPDDEAPVLALAHAAIIKATL